MILYTKLGDDLDTIIKSFEINPAVTERQKQIWRQAGKKKAITHDMFGYDHEKALAFDDGTAVGSMKSNSARRFWDYAAGHVFPPAEDVARFCLFMHLDLYRALALVLKAEWERFFAHDMNDWKANNGGNLTDILFDADEHDLREALSRFQPQGDRLFILLTELASRHIPLPVQTGTADKSFLEGHTPATFRSLVNEMLMGRHHFYATESAELAHFIAHARQEFALLVEGTEDHKRAFSLEKAKWVALRQELEELYLLIENQRLKNAHTYREWLTVFGKEEIALREAVLDYEQSDIRYNLKMANPGWTLQDIERYIKEEETKRQLELSRLRTDTALAPHLMRRPGEENGKEGTEPTRYIKECKTVLRQIRRLLHPDRLMHHPSYKHFTEGQKERLQELLLSALDIRPEELGYPEGYLLHDMRSLEGLKNALSRIEAILGNPGIDTDERLTIKGETLPEKLGWLQRENRILEDEILAAKAELQVLLEDEDTADKRAILDNPANHERIKADFEARTQNKRQEAESLKAQFNALFE
ncbi:MAG: hypothetical protein A4E58_02973 [Syntrophorhabdus sp. PtaB.Bin006]|nr:MAG: hypothetical protein A4E58_02973 [Syntrophorhabdus sp. PtaB.Bin006]